MFEKGPVMKIGGKFNSCPTPTCDGKKVVAVDKDHIIHIFNLGERKWDE